MAETYIFYIFGDTELLAIQRDWLARGDGFEIISVEWGAEFDDLHHRVEHLTRLEAEYGP
jgi:hypothetical protein